MIDFEPVLQKLGLTEAPCPVLWTRKHLHFWEAGAYFQSESAVWIELNPACPLKFLGYTPQKILEHEFIHAMRAHFPDSVWEELLAYQMATYTYQKILGPFLSDKLNVGLLFLSSILALHSLSALVPALILTGRFITHMRRYRGLKRLMALSIEKGMAPNEAFRQILTLSPIELQAKIFEIRSSLKRRN